jgi:hypothetical protein
MLDACWPNRCSRNLGGCDGQHASAERSRQTGEASDGGFPRAGSDVMCFLLPAFMSESTIGSDVLELDLNLTAEQAVAECVIAAASSSPAGVSSQVALGAATGI